jgi:hypothetical protein
MTQLGHTLTGIAIGVAVTPTNKSRHSTLVFINSVIFGFLANIPDFTLKHWGHDLYYFSHSLFVNLMIILIILTPLVFLKDLREKIGGWVVIVGGALAWLSHLLLDTFYNHGKGLLMFWPLTDRRLALPLPWFSVVKISSLPLTPEQIHSLLAELVLYGGILFIIILIRRLEMFKWIRRHVSTDQSK